MQTSSRSISTTPVIHWRYLLPVCLVAAMGGLLFGYDTGVISGAIEPITQHFGLTDFMKGWAASCVLLGCAAGVLIAGPISDRFGRKIALMLAALMFLISSVGTSIPNSIWAFIVFRILGGIGIGIASMATPLYVAEISPANVRGRTVSVNTLAIVLGIAATAFINYCIAAQGDAAWKIASGWRWMFAAGIAPSVIFGLLLLTIPESPRWLVEVKRSEEAYKIFTKVGGAAFAEAEIAAIRDSLSGEQGTWRDILSPSLRRPLLVGFALAILQQVTGINVFLYFGATIFKTLSQSTGVDAGLLQQIIINGAMVISVLIAMAVVDRWGRKPLMLIGSACMGISLIVMGIMAQTSVDPAAAVRLMLIFILLYIVSFGLSVGPVIWVILSEIFPTAVRGRAMGLATFCLWIADYAVIQTFPLMDANDSWFVAHFNHAFPFYLYAGMCLVLILVMACFVFETKDKSLEEIEKDWR